MCRLYIVVVGEATRPDRLARTLNNREFSPQKQRNRTDGLFASFTTIEVKKLHYMYDWHER
jgi:hypothetical protein